PSNGIRLVVPRRMGVESPERRARWPTNTSARIRLANARSRPKGRTENTAASTARKRASPSSCAASASTPLVADRPTRPTMNSGAALRCLRGSSVVVLIVILTGVAAGAFAQQKSAPDRPVVLIGGGYGTPMGLFGTAGVLIAAPRPMEPGGSPNVGRVG